MLAGLYLVGVSALKLRTAVSTYPLIYVLLLSSPGAEHSPPSLNEPLENALCELDSTWTRWVSGRWTKGPAASGENC